ncbi:MAG: Cholesterol 7-alpha-monooxygenase [Alectoria sarmentosa]|nr:MAG: Cholesterol 7-alpha-monooxygenase [Alectoria sarmentosa]
MILTPSLIRPIFESYSAAISFDSVRWFLLVNVFGANKRHEQEHSRAHGDAHALLHQLSPGPSEMLRTTVRGIQEQGPNLVSFSDSIVDQNPWERAATPIIHHHTGRITGDASSVEVSLFALIRTFVGSLLVPSLVGREFLENYPEALEDIQDLDDGLKYLVLGLPRWLPIPSLSKAHIARRRLLDAIRSLHGSLDQTAAGNEPNQPWRDLSDVGAVLKGRHAIWNAYGTPRDIRASSDLSLLWGMSTKTAKLVFWILVRLYSTPGLIQKVRDEIHPFAKALQPSQFFGIPEPVRLEIDDAGLMQSCPLLKACLYECLRLHSEPISMRSVQKDISVLESPEDGRSIDGERRQTFVLEAGDFVASLPKTHQRDPHYYEFPNSFQPGRFLRSSVQGQPTLVQGALNPWGLGEFACPWRVLAEQEVLAFVAAIVVLWDLESMDSHGWIVPRQKISAMVSLPLEDIRVEIRPRDLPIAR